MKLPFPLSPRGRLGLLLLAMAAVLAAGLAYWRPWLSDAPPPTREALTIGLADVLNVAPALIAEERGFFRDEGLDLTVKHFPNGKTALEAQLRGEVDVATVAETPIAINSLKRRDFVVIGSYMYSTAESKLVAHPESGIRSAKDLQGRRVGVMAGTTAQFFLHSLLVDHGLTAADISEVPLPGPEMAEALAARRVDAIAAFEPYTSQALAAIKDQGSVIDSGGRVQSTTCYTSSRDFPVQRAGAARRLLRATQRAIVWMSAHRQEAIALMAQRLDISVKDLDLIWDDYFFNLALDQGLIISLEEEARWAMQTGIVSGTQIPNYLDFIDFTALAAVKPEAITVIREP